MKRILVLVGILSYFVAPAQRVNGCGIIIPPQSLQSNFQSVYEARDFVNAMLDSINWKENFLVQEQNGINNAYATIISNRRYIIYDNAFLENLDTYARTKWASVSVLAHEMGHHYRNHVVDRQGSTPPKELEADYFSGYVMAKLGAGAAEAVAAMENIASARASATHPAKADRLKAIQQGWNYAKGLTPSTSTTPNPANPGAPQQTPPPAAPDASWIYLSLYSAANMQVFLSDNGKTYAPAALDTKQPFVFKFEVYNYGWLRLTNSPRARTYKLLHGKDYAIVWSRRTNSWTVVEVP
ncbi:MAG TPA: M48 family metalloprotease [Flavisolibacter sp.]|nr:M48 family metalloprotease [Flavisolibacter sp.]